MSDFDRLRPRSAAADSAPGAGVNGSAPRERADVQGKRALFSVDAPSATARGAFRLTCSGCGATSSLTPRQALTAAVPSLHLPVLRRKFPSWMRCPACRRHRWVRIDLGH